MPQGFNTAHLGEEVQTIIGKEPAWLIRWGMVVMSFAIAMMLVISYVVKYPDLVTTRITITTARPPIPIIARGSGKLDKLFVVQGSLVKAGDPLAVLDSAAHFEDIQKVKTAMADFENFLYAPEQFLDHQWPRAVRLGEMADAYSNFLTSFLDLRSLMRDDVMTTRIQELEKQRANYEKLTEKLNQRALFLDEELAIEEAHFNSQETLFKEKLLSETDMGKARTNLLSKKMARQNLDESLIHNRISISSLDKQIMELTHERREGNRQYLLKAQESYKLFREALQSWERQYMLHAPSSGKISLFRYWSNDQYVVAGEEVMTLLPEGNELIGKIHLPQQGAGRVATNQLVRIKFDSYPYTEFGMVTGKVTTFSPVSHESTYLLDVSLPDGLVTSYRKELQFKYNMQGTAEIVTRDMRLIERIFNQFRHLLTSRVSA